MSFSDEANLRVLLELHADPNVSQRQLAGKLTVSLGRINAIINSLIERGWVNASGTRGENNRVRYAYILTPNGKRQKTRLVRRSLAHKRDEVKALTEEISQLVGELPRQGEQGE